MNAPSASRPSACAALLLVCTAAAHAVPAAAPSQDPPPRPVSTEEARAVRRVLTLADGRTLRTTARSREGRWEIQGDDGWTALPGGAVVHAARESDLLTELDRRRRTAEEGPLAERTAVARWALEAGLVPEGMTQVGRVLDEAPDDLEARAALASVAHHVALPRVDVDAPEASASEVLAWSSGRGRVGRELAVLELARVRDREVLAAALQQSLSANTAGRRATAVLGLRRLLPGRALPELVGRAVLDVAPEVRAEASLALAGAGRPGLVGPVARALEHAHGTVRLQAAEALGNMGYAAAVAPLVARLSAVAGAPRPVPHAYVFFGTQTAYVQDFDVEVAPSQAVADPQVNVLVQGSVLDAGVHSLTEEQARAEGRALRTALGRLTGADPGGTNRAWLDWWDRDGQAWYASEMAALAGPGRGE